MGFILTEDTVGRILKNADASIEMIKDMSKLPPDMIFSDTKTRMVFRYCFLVTIQAIFTMSNYLVVRKKLGIPKDYHESLMLLVEAKIINPKMEDVLGKLVGIRNLLLHEGVAITITNIKEILEQTDNIIGIYNSVKSEVQKSSMASESEG